MKGFASEMYPEGLVFGIVDLPRRRRPGARVTSSATSRSRGRGTTIGAGSSRARRSTAYSTRRWSSATGGAWCRELGTSSWSAGTADELEGASTNACRSGSASDDFLALGAAGNDSTVFSSTCAAGTSSDVPISARPLVDDVGEALDGRRVSLGRLSPDEGSRLARYIGDGIGSYRRDGRAWLDPRIGDFLKEVRRQVLNAPRGVFLWNLEPYDDVRYAAERLRPADLDALQRGVGLQAEHDPGVARLRRREPASSSSTAARGRSR